MDDNFDPLRSVLTALAWGGVFIAVLLLVLMAPWYWSVGIAAAIAAVLRTRDIAPAGKPAPRILKRPADDRLFIELHVGACDAPAATAPPRDNSASVAARTTQDTVVVVVDVRVQV